VALNLSWTTDPLSFAYRLGVKLVVSPWSLAELGKPIDCGVKPVVALPSLAELGVSRATGGPVAQTPIPFPFFPGPRLMQSEPRFGRTKDAAARWGIPKSTLEKLRVYGGGPAFIKVGKTVLYDLAAGDAWLLAHQRSSTGSV
jgi:hypothetical protein